MITIIFVLQLATSSWNHGSVTYFLGASTCCWSESCTFPPTLGVGVLALELLGNGLCWHRLRAPNGVDGAALPWSAPGVIGAAASDMKAPGGVVGTKPLGMCTGERDRDRRYWKQQLVQNGIPAAVLVALTSTFKVMLPTDPLWKWICAGGCVAMGWTRWCEIRLQLNPESNRSRTKMEDQF